MKCSLLFCENEATHWCIDCDRPICMDVKERHTGACFDVHNVVPIEQLTYMTQVG